MSDNFIRLDMKASNMGRLCWIFFLGPVALYILVNIIYSGFGEFWNIFIGLDTFTFIVILFITYFVHEALHVLAGLIVGAKLSSFSFGFDKTTLSIECGCCDEMTVQGYQFMLLLPFLVLTPLLAVLAYTNGSHLWWQMLALSTSGCTFDLTMAIGLMGIHAKTRIIPTLKGENGYVYVKAAS